MKLIIGIDFGTSTTVVRYKWLGSDSICLIKDADGSSDLIPTVIFRPAANGAPTLYGKVAESRYNGGEDGELITNFKIGLASSDPEILNKSKAQIKEFLAYVYSCFAKQTLGMNTTDCDVYVSYPAKWPSSLAKYMKDVIREVGFPGKIHGLFEPVAAVQNALKSHLEHLKSGRLLTTNKPLNMLMLDMGAGTSDIYICKLSLETIDGEINVAISDGTSFPSIDDPSLCGGREIDETLLDLISNHLKKTLELNDEDIQELFKLSDAKTWKDEHLSNTLKTSGIAGLPQKVLGAIAPLNKFLPKTKIEAVRQFTINRATFEDRTKSHWRVLYNMIESAISLHHSKYGISAEDIDLILLTGGHSAWYTVPKLFNGDGIGGQIAVDHEIDGKVVKATHFCKIENEPWRIFSDARPHESVARGLVLHPEGIPIPATSPNNVWIRMKINDKATDYVKILDINDQLPITIKDKGLNIAFRSQRLQHVYNAEIEVLTGRTLETANSWTYNKSFNDLVGAIILSPLVLLFGVDYKFNLTYTMICEEDGCIHFDAQFKKDNEDPIEIKF